MGLLSKKQAAAWVPVARETELPAVGDSLAVSHNGRDYVLFRLEGGVFCTQGSCSHEYSPLCDGMVDGCEVFCEKHGSRFDIPSGAVLSPPADRDLETHPVRIEDGIIAIFV
jgi:3-phenylpropionate/trans-cinnamate dioxygenase ferredoxin subunit